MRKLFLVVLFALLPACSILGPLEPISQPNVPTSLPEAGQQAQNAVNEANLSLAAVANVIAANVKDAVWTKAQAQGYLDRVKDYAKKMDRAQELVNLGRFTEGKTQAETVKALILILHREVAAQARKEGVK